MIRPSHLFALGVPIAGLVALGFLLVQGAASADGGRILFRGSITAGDSCSGQLQMKGIAPSIKMVCPSDKSSRDVVLSKSSLRDGMSAVFNAAQVSVMPLASSDSEMAHRYVMLMDHR